MPNSSSTALSPGPPADEGGTPALAPDVFQMTCGLDGRAHLTTVSSVEVDIVSDRGAFTALCGHVIHAAALGTPPGAACGDCHRRPHRRPEGVR